jgi:hypothetical protein
MKGTSSSDSSGEWDGQTVGCYLEGSESTLRCESQHPCLNFSGTENFHILCYSFTFLCKVYYSSTLSWGNQSNMEALTWQVGRGPWD